MQPAELAAIVERAQRLEPAALEALVDAYACRLFGYLYRMTGSHADAEDLLQEVFLRMVRTIGEYQHDGRFEAWLFRIGTNLARDRLRRRRARRTVQFAPTGHDGKDEPAELGVIASDGDPSARLAKAEDRDRLQAALSQLSEPERQVVMLRHFSHMSFREIAEAMGTPIGTALARAHRALSRLRALMEPA
jgi:RNA polymerase sigma-70 factor (ECF subfamily)